MAFIDGSSMGNPGEAGCGVLIKDENDGILVEAGRYIGRATNNAAEYRGLLTCLELSSRLGATTLTVYSDSELLVNQMRGTYRIKQPHLKELHSQAWDMIKSGSIQLRMIHISREKNREADALARRAIRLRSDIDEMMDIPEGRMGDRPVR